MCILSQLRRTNDNTILTTCQTTAATMEQLGLLTRIWGKPLLHRSEVPHITVKDLLRFLKVPW